MGGAIGSVDVGAYSTSETRRLDELFKKDLPRLEVDRLRDIFAGDPFVVDVVSNLIRAAKEHGKYVAITEEALLRGVKTEPYAVSEDGEHIPNRDDVIRRMVGVSQLLDRLPSFNVHGSPVILFAPTNKMLEYIVRAMPIA